MKIKFQITSSYYNLKFQGMYDTKKHIILEKVGNDYKENFVDCRIYNVIPYIIKSKKYNKIYHFTSLTLTTS